MPTNLKRITDTTSDICLVKKEKGMTTNLGTAKK
jgi:hypothetical protein